MRIVHLLFTAGLGTVLIAGGFVFANGIIRGNPQQWYPCDFAGCCDMTLFGGLVFIGGYVVGRVNLATRKA